MLARGRAKILLMTRPCENCKSKSFLQNYNFINIFNFYWSK